MSYLEVSSMNNKCSHVLKFHIQEPHHLGFMELTPHTDLDSVVGNFCYLWNCLLSGQSKVNFIQNPFFQHCCFLLTIQIQGMLSTTKEEPHFAKHSSAYTGENTDVM